MPLVQWAMHLKKVRPQCSVVLQSAQGRCIVAVGGDCNFLGYLAEGLAL